jgi:protocatechuate 3,4-dioxygenase alpha subunit
VRIGGRLLDGNGQPVADGLIETWQLAPAGGRGFGRCPTDRDGRWAILTVKPQAARAADGRLHAPQIAVSVFARGLLRRAVTRLYFPDEEEANRADPLLAGIADEAARASLIAVPDGDGLRFDIRLQGQGETAFFDA